MRVAMQRVYGELALVPLSSYAGKTDQQIILYTFAELSPDHLPSSLEHFTATYIAELEARRAEFLARCRVLPGVAVALERLAAEPVVQTVLTGNLQPIAQIKLDLMGLARFLDLQAGAYGSDHHRRAELVPFAVARAEQRYGQRFAGADVVVIGDTPNDIDCGRAAGARTVAVATGPFSAAELRAHAPDAVLDDLIDINQVLTSIFGHGTIT
jgi:phosphoglycolate phosphatase-like HAD superfamily hydrolase